MAFLIRFGTIESVNSVDRLNALVNFLNYASICFGSITSVIEFMLMSISNLS